MPEHAQKDAVFIVGSTGLIGSALVERFAGAYRVFAMDVRPPEEDLPAGAEFMAVDVTSDESVREAVERAQAQQEGKLASVIQLAAYYDFSGEPSKLYDKITVQGARRMLKQAQAAGCEQFVFSSTMLVHAPTQPGKPLNEEQPIDAKWDYPQSKVDAENVIREEHGDVPAVLLRIAGVYTDECNSLPLSQQIRRMREKHMTAGVYPGDTQCGQAFVHLDDLVEAMWLTVEKRHDLPRDVVPILIGEPETPGYGEVQQKLARLIHDEPEWNTRQIPKAVAKSGAWLQENTPLVDDPFIKPWMVDLADDHYELDISRAKELLGWQPQQRLMDTLDKMVAAMQKDPEAWYRQHGLPLPEESVTTDGS